MRGIEFNGAHGGTDLRDVPVRPTVERAINDLGLNFKLLV